MLELNLGSSEASFTLFPSLRQSEDANFSMDKNVIRRANANFRWPNGAQIALVFNIAYEAWSHGEAPGIGPMGNVLKPGFFDTNAHSWASYGPTRGIARSAS